MSVVRDLLESAAGHIPDDIWEEVRASYAQPHRAYHTMDHIEEMLVLLETNRDKTEARFGKVQADALRAPLYVATVYHDLVYDPTRHDNEARSAQVLRAHFESAGWAEVAAGMVVDTTTHQSSSELANYLIDADLARFSAEPDLSQAYNDQIRLEYSHVPNDLWRAGRSRALLPFLAREPFYLTDMLGVAAARRARANIVAEIERYL